MRRSGNFYAYCGASKYDYQFSNGKPVWTSKMREAKCWKYTKKSKQWMRGNEVPRQQAMQTLDEMREYRFVRNERLRRIGYFRIRIEETMIAPDDYHSVFKQSYYNTNGKNTGRQAR